MNPSPDAPHPSRSSAPSRPSALSRPAEPGSLTPAQARSLFRDGLVTPTAGFSDGYAQANLLIVPQDMAFDVLLYAQRNPKPCPVLGVLEAGQTSSELLAGGDIRTDVPLYTVYEDGVKVDEPTDLTNVWRDDLVTFILGCSFSFEAALREENIPVAHIDQDVNVPMYRTNRPCVPAGAMQGPLVVSMRPIPAEQVADAVRITSRYPGVHGAPVHVGHPETLGIADLSRPDFGDAVSIPEGTVPVFWACGVTPQAAVMQSKPRLAFGHAPGHMLVTDLRNSALQVP